MDWNSLAQSGEAVWTLIGTMSATTALSVLTFIKTSISGKKFAKVSDFAVVANESIKFAKNEISEAKVQIVDEVKAQIVEPLKEQINALRSDNVQLTNLCATMLSLIPMNITLKREVVETLGNINSVSAQTQTLLETNLASQEEQERQTQSTNQTLSEDIDNI